MGEAALLSSLLLLRLLNAGLTQTYFQPDEFWQSLEVAHRIVFGYGYTTWEWRDARAPLERGTWSWSWSWDAVITGSPVRSVAYPAVFVPVYWALKVLALDDTFLLTLLPRLLQAVSAAAGDWYAFRLAKRVASERVAFILLVLTYTSPYALHTATRTFANSLEASLTVAALFYWPARDEQSPIKLGASLIPMSLAFMIRPTSALLWLFLGADLLLHTPLRRAPTLILKCAAAVVVALAAQVLLDSLYFGRLTVTALAFLQVNALGKSPVSLFYGHAPAHYYLSQALPVICTVVTPWALVGWALTSRSAAALSGVRKARDVRLLGGAALWVTLCMSVLGHKEWRFLQQLGPLWLLFAALVVDQRRAELDDAERKRTDGPQKSASSEEANCSSSLASSVQRAWADIRRGGARGSLPTQTRLSPTSLPPWTRHVLDRLPHLHHLLLAQLPLTAYLLLGHGRAQTQVMRHLHAQAHAIWSVGFLMPCHSTPWQAWLHAPALEGHGHELSHPSGDGGKAWFLSCEPPRDVEDVAAYRDQTRVFFEDPVAYLRGRFPGDVDPAFPPSPYPPGAKTAAAAGGTREWRHAWPSHLVLFETLLAKRSRDAAGAETEQNGSAESTTVGELLRRLGYVENKRLWNGFGSDDENRWGDVLVLAWRGPEPSTIAHPVIEMRKQSRHN